MLLVQAIGKQIDTDFCSIVRTRSELFNARRFLLSTVIEEHAEEEMKAFSVSRIVDYFLEMCCDEDITRNNIGINGERVLFFQLSPPFVKERKYLQRITSHDFITAADDVDVQEARKLLIAVLIHPSQNGFVNISEIGVAFEIDIKDFLTEQFGYYVDNEDIVTVYQNTFFINLSTCFTLLAHQHPSLFLSFMCSVFCSGWFKMQQCKEILRDLGEKLRKAQEFIVEGAYQDLQPSLKDIYHEVTAAYDNACTYLGDILTITEDYEARSEQFHWFEAGLIHQALENLLFDEKLFVKANVETMEFSLADPVTKFHVLSTALRKSRRRVFHLRCTIPDATTVEYPLEI